jgi:hypothetical protein
VVLDPARWQRRSLVQRGMERVMASVTWFI